MYNLRIFKYVKVHVSDDCPLDHVELADYPSDTAPWVPPRGSFYRLRDPSPNGRAKDHTEKTGYVRDVVTIRYGHTTVIEVYISDVEPSR